MPGIPRHIGVKIGRAQNHLEQAKAISDRVLEPYFHTIKVQFDKKGRRHTCRLGAIQELPPLFNVLLGETAFQLRSTLDHLVFALANPVTDRQARDAQFPIFSVSRKFRENANRMLPGTPRDVRTIVERLQPYHRRKFPETHLLAQLQEVNNWDKHRLLPTIAVSIEIGSMKFRRSDGKLPAIASQKLYAGVLKPNAIIARVEYADDPTTAPQMKMESEFTLRVVFDRSMPKIVAGHDVFVVLDNAGRFIANAVLPMFTRFF